MRQLLSHMLIGVVGLNQGRLPGGGDVKRASRFGFQVILEFLLVPLKVRTKGDEVPFPFFKADHCQ